jgi:hypothetical protein
MLQVAGTLAISIVLVSPVCEERRLSAEHLVLLRNLQQSPRKSFSTMNFP